MTEPGGSEGIWKAVAICLMGIVVTLLGCIYSQDRDRATKQDLAPIAATVNDTRNKVDDLTSELSFVKGQLKAKKMLEP